MACATVLLSCQELLDTRSTVTSQVGTYTFTRAQEEADQDDAGAWARTSQTAAECPVAQVSARWPLWDPE